jgi:hypothetical protein
LAHVADDAHDREHIFDAAEAEPELFPDRILVGPMAAHHRLVDDGDAGRITRIAGID